MVSRGCYLKSQPRERRPDWLGIGAPQNEACFNWTIMDLVILLTIVRFNTGTQKTKKLTTSKIDKGLTTSNNDSLTDQSPKHHSFFKEINWQLHCPFSSLMPSRILPKHCTCNLKSLHAYRGLCLFCPYPRRACSIG